MSSNKECAEYFRDQKAYDRCFKELWRKWRSYGRAAGRITLKNASAAECKAIGGIIGKTFFDGAVQFSFTEFENGLQKTRFAPVDMKQVLEAYFGESLCTNHAEREEKERQKNYFLEKIRNYFEKEAGRDGAASKWLEALITEKKYGYQIVIREYGKDPQQARLLMENVGNALTKLEGLEDTRTDYPLAVLAADVSGNPHYFDRGCVGGVLLVHGICCLKGVELPADAHSWRALLQNVKVMPDNISSIVHACGLRLKTGYGWHPAYDAFCEQREPYVITMENMRGVIGADTIAQAVTGKSVYIVENEMVFTYLLNHLQNQTHTLLCTSGQPRSVALLLIPMILESGAQIYYSGDIDPDGIRIADNLWKKFGDRIHMWRMSTEDYEKSCSMETIGESGISKLENISHPQLKTTAEAVRVKGLAGYQENILQELLKDIRIQK